jgi:hypothetical protein
VLVEREVLREEPDEGEREGGERGEQARFRALDPRTVAVGRKCFDVLQILDKNFGHLPKEKKVHGKR